MAMPLGALRNALLEAGVRTDEADKAAEEGAAYGMRLAGLETRVSVLTWMVGAKVGLTMLSVGGPVTLAAKLGDIGGQLTQIARSIH